MPLVAELVGCELFRSGEDPVAGDADCGCGRAPSRPPRRPAKGGALDGGQPECPPVGRGQLLPLAGRPAGTIAPAVLGLEAKWPVADGSAAGWARGPPGRGCDRCRGAGTGRRGHEVDQEVAGDCGESQPRKLPKAGSQYPVPRWPGATVRKSPGKVGCGAPASCTPLATGQPVDQRLGHRHRTNVSLPPASAGLRGA